MELRKLNQLLRNRYLLAVLSGVIYAAAFPKIGIAGLAWIAPALILFSARGTRGKQAFKIGCAAGFTMWLCLLYWLLNIPYRWMGLPLGPALGWIVLSAFMALYIGGWVWMCQEVQATRVKAEGLTWMQRSAWALFCAVLWVAMEMLRARILSGFPWAFLGISQHKMTPLIQIASITGVYGVSFLVTWFSVSLLNTANILIQKPASYRSLMAEIIVPLVVVVAVSTWGFSRLVNNGPDVSREVAVGGSASLSPRSAGTLPGFLAADRTLRMALVQPSIPQEVIWDPGAIPERFDKLMRLSEAALKEKPDVLVWPEAAMPGFSKEHFSAITNMVANHKVWMILGADDAERKLEGTPNDYAYFNASFLFDPSGAYVAGYRKLRLVMFGEYVPFTRWFPFMKWFTPVEGGFTPGKGPVQFRMGELSAQTTVLICFEDVFPHHTRHYVEGATDFLLNLTNDGWFGRSANQWQHAMTALFRAVENGVPIVRCTNNGLTCWIDEFGRLRDYHRGHDGSVYSEGYLIAEVPIGKAHPQTFYNRHGDWFGWSCVGTGFLSLALALMTKRRAAGSK